MVRIYTPEELAESAERHARLKAAEGLIRVVDAKDTYAGAHSQQVSRLVEGIARAMGLDEETVEQVRLAGLLHDLGKIAIPDRILQKPGKLDPDELRIMREHAELGYRLLEGLGVSPVDRWIRHHHEWWDGSGYPLGLAGEDIPLGSRIILVADAFDAMTSDRVYRAAGSAGRRGGRAAPALLDAVRRAGGVGAREAPGDAGRGDPRAGSGDGLMFLLPAVIIGVRLRLRCWAAGWAGWPTCGCARRGLFYLAIGLQIVAFSSLFGSPRAARRVATAFSIGSYGCLLAVFVLNRRLPGMPIAGAGHAAEPGGDPRQRRPHAGAALGHARRRAQPTAASTTTASPRRRRTWPGSSTAGRRRRWAPMANVYSVGDVLIGLGAAVIVAAAMGARVPLRGRSADAAATPDQG